MISGICPTGVAISTRSASATFLPGLAPTRSMIPGSSACVSVAQTAPEADDFLDLLGCLERQRKRTADQPDAKDDDRPC